MVINEHDICTTTPQVIGLEIPPAPAVPVKLDLETVAGPLRLDLGCGANKREGFLGVDISKDCGADLAFDLKRGTWPWDNESVDEVHCSHFFEHLSGPERIPFMAELWRVMKPGAKALFITPDCDSHRAIQDPTHAWPPVCAESYLYFNKNWRDQNKLSHYNINCDFDFGYGFSMDVDVAVRSNDFQQFALKHYRNHSTDLHVTLTRK